MRPFSDRPRDRLSEAILADLERYGPSRVEDVMARVEDPFVPRMIHRLHNLLTQYDDGRWRLRDEALPATAWDRPRGPFGPASRLLPRSQRLFTVGPTAACRDVLETMIDREYSAVPIVENERVTGVVTFESIHRAMLKLRTDAPGSTLEAAHAMPVSTARRDVIFVAPHAYIDEGIDWLRVEHVIVGTPERPIGLLTISDVWRYLDAFAHAFALIHEIEIGLRRFIAIVLNQANIEIDEALAGLDIPTGRPTPTSLDHLSFQEHYKVMTLATVEHHFAPHLATLEDAEWRFREVNQIRNDIAHFRQDARPTVPDDDRPDPIPLRQLRRWVQDRIEAATSG